MSKVNRDDTIFRDGRQSSQPICNSGYHYNHNMAENEAAPTIDAIPQPTLEAMNPNNEPTTPLNVSLTTTQFLDST